MSRYKQVTDKILMVRPAQFGYNTETAGTNIFQRNAGDDDRYSIQQNAVAEFDQLVQLLRSNKIYVIVMQDPGMPVTPDAVFPNNWISFHEDAMVLYPMLAANRRQERRSGWIRFLKDAFHKERVIDLSVSEPQHQYLEGTGSLVLDRMNSIAYANLSSRTHEKVLKDFAGCMGYDLVTFRATDNGQEIYHTNVMMAIGEKTALICTGLIQDASIRNQVKEKLSVNREIVELTREQIHHFAGNMLLVKNRDGQRFWVMSDLAFHSLTESQRAVIYKDGELISSPLTTIETTGGGSARCMMAEIF